VLFCRDILEGQINVTALYVMSICYSKQIILCESHISILIQLTLGQIPSHSHLSHTDVQSGTKTAH